jgi:hypothetical protein
VEVVPEEDVTGDLSLLNLHHDSATSGQLHLGRLRKEIDMEDKIKKRDSLLFGNPRIIERVPGIIDRHGACSRHLQAVDIAGFTLDGKKYLFLWIPTAEPLFAGVSNPYA